MKRKTVGTKIAIAALVAALGFTACDAVVVNFSGIPYQKTGEQDGAESSAQEQEGQGLETYVLNYQRTAWEAEHPDPYSFYQRHRIGDREVSGSISVENDLADASALDENALEPLLLSSTLSELYEKIDALGNDERYANTSLAITYDDQYHYPTRVEIKNITESGDAYVVDIIMVPEKIVINVEDYLTNPTKPPIEGDGIVTIPVGPWS
jgi:hypothetical protein